MNATKWYIEVHSTMTDNTFFFVCDDEETAEVSVPLVHELLRAVNEDEYMRTLLHIELNGIQLLDDPNDIDSNWEQYTYIEERF